MSLSISKTEGSTVITLTSDPRKCLSSSVPNPQKPVLQPNLLLCVPAPEEAPEHLSDSTGDSADYGWAAQHRHCFMLFGIVSILSEKYPSPCLVIVNVILNLAGVGFAIAAITLYSLRMTNMWLYWLCENHNNQYYYHHSPTASSGEKRMEQECLETKNMMMMLLWSMHGLMIVLSALELCLTISSSVLGIKALKRRGKDEKMNEEPEYYKPLLDEVPGNPEV
ncbi:hypothetical protein CesoFtcFv8_012522 [Champsocephalus esox]|uniref:Uncharacterized protein n=1 Tax=Champsocephalus esox TaxID=159716 RepID=A0AAN8BZ19_9TELE|nr:hypothetical protein CesoFtcFv8_012522 [Champsocephalus esox]